MEKMNIALIAINKFFFYAQNYPCVEVTFPSIRGVERREYLPSFFKAFEPHLVEHLMGKWVSATHNTDSYGYLMKFYGELDGSNRQKMLKYIMENYNDEQKIPLIPSVEKEYYGM
jgi:hypothetical protein